MSEKEKIVLTEDGLFNVVGGIMAEMVRFADEEATLVEENILDEAAKIKVMKANTLLTFATMFAFAIVETRNLPAARLFLEVWNYPIVRDLTNIAFKEEIDAATASVDEMLSMLEEEANKETNEPSSESSS